MLLHLVSLVPIVLILPVNFGTICFRILRFDDSVGPERWNECEWVWIRFVDCGQVSMVQMCIHVDLEWLRWGGKRRCAKILLPQYHFSSSHESYTFLL
jgi:hypothetical protein